MTSPGYYDLLETLPQPGCAICRLLQRDVTRHLDNLMYEFVLDPGIQKSFRNSRGLCNEHGHQLAKMGNVLGIASLYHSAILDIIALIDHTPIRSSGRSVWKPNDASGAALADALESKHVCLTCKFRDENEARYLHEIAHHLADSDGKLFTAYQRGEGLCLPHFRALLRAIPSSEQARRVAAAQRAIFDRLKDELSEFMRKSDFTNAAESIGVEGDSWRRAIAKLSGEEGIFGVQHEE